MPTKLVNIGHAENLIVVSDVHLREPQDQTTQLFVDFLQRVGHDLPCDVLVLLGDIFDFFNARQSFYYRLWIDVFTQLKHLSEKGIKVIFVEGNHDYGFEYFPCDEIRSCFFACGDVMVRVQHKTLGEIVLLHSDDVVCPPSYRLFRSVVKSALFQTLLAPIPGWLTSALFARYARLSRSRDQYRPLQPSFLSRCSTEFVQRLSVDMGVRPSVCVFGHIHVNLDDQMSNVQFFSGPAWFTSPSALVIPSSGEVQRYWLGQTPSVVPRFSFKAGEEPLDARANS